MWSACRWRLSWICLERPSRLSTARLRCLQLPHLQRLRKERFIGILNSLTGFGGRDMAVDLGTANTLVYVRGRGIVLSEPSVVAIDQRTGDVHAVGIEAKRMLGRTPGDIQAIRPLKDGVIADIGGGTTEVAVISLGGIVVSQSIRVGGDELDDAIIEHVKREYKLMIGSQTAEEVKLEIGSAAELPEEVEAEIRGRDLVSGLPKTVVLSSAEVRLALEVPLSQIIDAVKQTLDKTPPELASDIMDRGIVLAGGGALLQRLTERIRNETQMPVHLAESPLTCVAVGSGRSLEEFDAIHRANQAYANRRRNGRRSYSY